MNKVLIIVGALFGGILLLALCVGMWIIGTRNSLIAKNEEVTAGWSQVENQLKRRADLIPNLVNTVKGYANHEKDAIQAVSDARARLSGAGASMADRAKAEGELSGALSRLLAVVENYPNLKADKSFQSLMDELAGTENRIGVARRDYNEMVKVFNTAIQQIPGCFFGFTKRDYFEIEEKDKAVPQVSF